MKKVKEVSKRPEYPVKGTVKMVNGKPEFRTTFTPEEKKALSKYNAEKLAYMRYKYGGKTINRLIDMLEESRNEYKKLKAEMRKIGSVKKQAREEVKRQKLLAKKAAIEKKLAKV